MSTPESSERTDLPEPALVAELEALWSQCIVEAAARQVSAEILYGARAYRLGQAAGATWQPIETAPKDRLLLLVRPDRDAEVGWWVEASPADDSELDNGLDAGWFGQGGLWPSGSPDDQPTHWMPLPAPPARPEGAVPCPQDT